MAQQALTTAAASNCRFTLGIGLSHQIVIEGMLGLSYDKPARHMREYLNVLMPLVRGETCNFQGEHYRVSNMAITVPGATSMPVVVAALGPAMLKLAGELADGTNTWMVGPKTMENHIIARIGAAARDAGKPDPRIVAGFPVILTNKPDEAREKIAEQLTMYGQLPSYRAMLDLEGVAGPADIAIAGDENALRGEIKRLEDIGVTDFNAAITPVEEGSYERTLEFLTSMKP
jgi:F420-dependent oxidoreductase-like protein